MPRLPIKSGLRLIASHRTAVEVGGLVNLYDMDCQVVTDKQAEKASAVVCIGAHERSMFTDNVRGPCRDCGDMLQWRPHAPKKPPKLCVDCATIRTNRIKPLTSR